MPQSNSIENPRATRRLAWLDIVRGWALLAMASYHLMWNLAYFGYLEPEFPSTGWPRIYARSIASTFLFLAGFSLVLAHGRGIRWHSFWKRWLIVACAAAIVTAATYFAIFDRLIYFGILHAIAAASLVGLIFLRLPWFVSLLAAAAAFVAPLLFRSELFNHPWLWWIGLSTEPRPSFDFVPMLPWLAPFLIGMAIAQIPAVATWLRQNAPGDKSHNMAGRTISFFGRHSLVFYLVHQPVLISIVFVVSLAYPSAGQPDAFVRSCTASCTPGADVAFCKRFCDCALGALERQDLLRPLQSGAIPDEYRGEIDKIRSQCTVAAEQAPNENGN